MKQEISVSWLILMLVITLHVVVLPRPTDVLRGIALKALAVDVGKDIELAVGITDGWCPDTLTVDLLVVLQRESIVVEVETIKSIADVLPVDEVFGMEDDKSWHGVHCCAGEIVVVAHTEDVRIGELVVEQRVGVRAIAIVSLPRTLLGVCQR